MLPRLDVSYGKKGFSKCMIVFVALGGAVVDFADGFLGCPDRGHKRREFIGFQGERTVWPGFGWRQSQMFLDDRSA